jgi:hypothetical protein
LISVAHKTRRRREGGGRGGRGLAVRGGEEVWVSGKVGDAKESFREIFRVASAIPPIIVYESSWSGRDGGQRSGHREKEEATTDGGW